MSPFKSQKQRKFLYANKPAVAKKFARHSKQKGGVLTGTLIVILLVLALPTILVLMWIF